VLVRLEAWHPDRSWRWSSSPQVELPADPEAPLPTLPCLPSLRPFLGERGWVLRFRHEAAAVVALLCADSPPWSGEWREAPGSPSLAP
jgi:hypothetical protein